MPRRGTAGATLEIVCEAFSAVVIRDTRSAETGFELGISPQPETTDAVVEVEGARVFLDAGAALALEDKVLDAQMEQDGSVRFALAVQG